MLHGVDVTGGEFGSVRDDQDGIVLHGIDGKMRVPPSDVIELDIRYRGVL